MITPVFEVAQDENFVIVTMQVPHMKVWAGMRDTVKTAVAGIGKQQGEDEGYKS